MIEPGNRKLFTVLGIFLMVTAGVVLVAIFAPGQLDTAGTMLTSVGALLGAGGIWGNLRERKMASATEVALRQAPPGVTLTVDSPALSRAVERGGDGRGQ